MARTRKRTYTASQIAKWFIMYNQAFVNDGSGENISNLKLQKLLYYAQGCFLAINDRPLFNDPIVAWAYGPVVESVYQEYKANGSNGIPCDFQEPPNISKDDENILEEVYMIFGKYSAIGLMNLTHKETPWQETLKNHTISINSISAYFKEHYVEK